jgi:hypothetical protein
MNFSTQKKLLIVKKNLFTNELFKQQTLYSTKYKQSTLSNLLPKNVTKFTKHTCHEHLTNKSKNFNISLIKKLNKIFVNKNSSLLFRKNSL